MKNAMIKTMIPLFALAIITSSASAMASGAFSCASARNQLGGNVSVSIGAETNGQASLELFAQGGAAHYMTYVGPVMATVTHEPDGSFYKFTDNFGQEGTVAVITTNINGQLETVASTDFGMWKNASMICK